MLNLFYSYSTILAIWDFDFFASKFLIQDLIVGFHIELDKIYR